MVGAWGSTAADRSVGVRHSGKGNAVRHRVALLAIPLLLGSTLALSSPAQTRAANGMTETGVTTYEVLPSKAQIKVTVVLSDHNTKPNSGGYYYYWAATEMAEELQGGAITATSNGGKVKQKVLETGNYYRFVELDYPPVLYGQTRVVTATYSIPAGPKASGGFRALSAYASFCAVGNGVDSGSIQVVVPDGFELWINAGDDLSLVSDKNGKQVYTTGTSAQPYKLFTCVNADKPGALVSTPITAGQQSVTVQSWPEDASWNSIVTADVTADIPALEKLTGLTMDETPVKIIEAGDSELGDYGGLYDTDNHIAYIPETVQDDTIAHELSHIWFNGKTLADKWMSEGLAGFSEQAAGGGKYTPCKSPGTYPGSGQPNLDTWLMLDSSSTTQDIQVSDYQYAASCYIFTTLAGDMGADSFRAVLVAAFADEMAYQPTPKAKSSATMPITGRHMLDLIDELGMVPGGVEDLDTAGDLLAKFGIFDESTLGKRSVARAAYHDLLASADAWHIPPVILNAMESWDFATAETAMDTAKDIIAARDDAESKVSGLALDGTTLQTDFETATTQTDLDDLLVTMQKVLAAANTVSDAASARDASHTILQTIGLIGTDLDAPLTRATEDLKALKLDTASAEAQTVIDAIDSSGGQGVERTGLAFGAVLALLLLAMAVVLVRRRRQPPVPVAAAPTPGLPGMPGMPGTAPDGRPLYGYPTMAGQWGSQPAQYGQNLAGSQWQTPAVQPAQWPEPTQPPEQWPEPTQPPEQWPEPRQRLSAWPARVQQPAAWPTSDAPVQAEEPLRPWEPSQSWRTPPAQTPEWPAAPAQPAWPPAPPLEPEPPTPTQWSTGPQAPAWPSWPDTPAPEPPASGEGSVADEGDRQ
jgi:hypothetical protein